MTMSDQRNTTPNADAKKVNSDLIGIQIGAPDDDGAFSVREFCERYDIGITAFYEEINEGRLIVKKRGSRTLVSRASARAWFHALPTIDTRKPASAAK